VSEKTIRNWLKGRGGRTGRPARGPAERRRAFVLVARTAKKIGFAAGWRTQRRHLGAAVPVRLLQECLREVKRLHTVHERRRIEARRVHVEVHFANVLWHQDAAHLGRTSCDEVQSDVLRDAAVKTEALAASVGGEVTGADAVRNLEAAIAAAGGPPFAISTDNGPPYKSKRYRRCLRRHRIVHLRNLPHTPQHNARGERGIRDVKEESGLGRGVRLADVDEAAVRVAAACRRLASRARFPGTSAPLTVRYTEKQRDRFYKAVRRRVRAAVLRAPNRRAARMAEREAIFRALEEEGLTTRTRGGAPMPATKAEINS
jgi:transposase InsO family protein